MNALDIITETLPPFTERERIRSSKPFKDFIYKWNHGRYNSRQQVGQLMDSTQAYSSSCGGLQGMSRAGWAGWFFKNNRTPEQVIELVNTMAQNEDLDFPTALTYWWIHIMDGAYQGEVNELNNIALLAEYSESKGYTVRRATPYEDVQLGVDAIVSDSEGKTVIGVQIKVKSYFLSSRETVVKAREQINPRKYARFQQEYNAQVWYMVIEDSVAAGKPVWRKAVM